MAGKLKRHKVEVVDKLWNAAGRCETKKDHFMNAALGLAAEAGEVADIHQDLWGFTTKEILEANEAKLFERYNVTT